MCHFRPENRTGGVTREAGRAVSRPLGSGERKGADPIVIGEPGAHCSMRLAVVDDAVYQMKEGTVLSGQYCPPALDVGKDPFGNCHRKALLIYDNGTVLQRRPSATMSQRKSWTRDISRRAGRMSAERNKMR